MITHPDGRVTAQNRREKRWVQKQLSAQDAAKRAAEQRAAALEASQTAEKLAQLAEEHAADAERRAKRASERRAEAEEWERKRQECVQKIKLAVEAARKESEWMWAEVQDVLARVRAPLGARDKR